MPPLQPSSYPLPDAQAEESYQEFVSRPQPTDLRQELAIQRAFLAQTMDAVRIRTGTEIDAVADKVLSALEQTLRGLGVPPENYPVIAAAFRPRLTPVLAASIPTSIDARILAVVLKVLKSITETAERMERIQRGRRIKVLIDTTRLSWLTRVFISRFVDRSRWPELIEVLRKHGLDSAAEGLAA